MKFDKLQEFRQAAYNHLGKAHDATFELTDAILTTRNAYSFAASALPGKAIVVLEQQSKIITDIVLIEDGHAQESSEPKVPLIYDSKQGHVSTTRLLEQYNHS
jgi:hypothetical protein